MRGVFIAARTLIYLSRLKIACVINPIGKNIANDVILLWARLFFSIIEETGGGDFCIRAIHLQGLSMLGRDENSAGSFR